jgi:hypothetical protein
MKLARRDEACLAQVPASVSESRLAANRANAQLSTGPKTSEGKAASSLNAVTTGLTGRTVLLPSEDAASYEKHVREFFDEHQPVGPREAEFVQSIADASWRLARIPRLEMTIYAHGRVQFADLFADQDAALRPGLIEMHTFLQYEKQLRNLHLQEGRLRRQREKDRAELSQLQKNRLAKESPEIEIAPADRDAVIGFEFSSVHIKDSAESMPPVTEPQIETSASLAIAAGCPKQSRDHSGAVLELSA